MKGGPHATLCISLRHRATPKDRLCGQVKRSLFCVLLSGDRLSCGSVRRRRMNSLFGWLHKYYDLWSSGMFEHKRSGRSERPGDSLRWRCSLIIIFVAFVLQYKYFSALAMILSYEWKFIQVATLGVASIKRSTGWPGKRRLNKVWEGLGSRGQWYEINVGQKYLWEHTKLFRLLIQ